MSNGVITQKLHEAPSDMSSVGANNERKATKPATAAPAPLGARVGRGASEGAGEGRAGAGAAIGLTAA